MTVKDVVCDALRLLGRDDIADAVTSSGTMSDEVKRYAKLFTLIADSVHKELYSCYFPDCKTDRLPRVGSYYNLSGLPYPMLCIRKVSNPTTGKEFTDYTITEYGMNVFGYSGEIAVTYDYTSHDYTSLTAQIDDYKPYVKPDLLVTGMVAEYYCTIGDTVNAALWQERYEKKIKLILDSGLYKACSEFEEIKVKNAFLPVRRWV